MYRRAKLPAVLAAFAVLSCSDGSPTGPGPAPAVAPSLDEVQVVTEPSACDQLKSLLAEGQTAITQEVVDRVCNAGLPLDLSSTACQALLDAGKFGVFLKVCLFGV
jgi:hypothetical protein